MKYHHISYISPPPHPKTKKKQQTKSTQHHLVLGSRIPSQSSHPLPPTPPRASPNDPTSTTFNLKVSPGESGTLRAKTAEGLGEKSQGLRGGVPVHPPIFFRRHMERKI